VHHADIDIDGQRRWCHSIRSGLAGRFPRMKESQSYCFAFTETHCTFVDSVNCPAGDCTVLGSGIAVRIKARRMNRVWTFARCRATLYGLAWLRFTLLMRL